MYLRLATPADFVAGPSRQSDNIQKMASEIRQVTIRHALWEWWRDRYAEQGLLRATVEFAARMGEFLRHSTPEQRRRRFGDADFDWDKRVDTTSATIHWRDRLIGTFTSGYQPTEPSLFHEMLRALPIDFHPFTFLDLGSGKGRALLMASDYPFSRIVGVELLPQLHRVAQLNLRDYRSATQQCFALESICADVRQFDFPPGPLLVYLFNPFPKSIFQQTITRLKSSITAHPRPVFIVYHNPLLEASVTRDGIFSKIAGTHQYSLLANREALSLARRI